MKISQTGHKSLIRERKIDKLDSFKFKNFYSLKAPVNRSRQAIDLEKIFAHQFMWFYKETAKPNIKKQPNQMGKIHDGVFP